MAIANKPRRHARYYEASAYRLSHPYQVEIFDFLVRVAAQPPRLVERMHAEFPGSASWCDHEGARTFGFTDAKSAASFQQRYGGTPKGKTE